MIAHWSAKVVFLFQAAVSKRTTAAAIASTCSPRERDSALVENVPEGRFKVAIPGQQVVEKLDAEERDGPIK